MGNNYDQLTRRLMLQNLNRVGSVDDQIADMLARYNMLDGEVDAVGSSLSSTATALGVTNGKVLALQSGLTTANNDIAKRVSFASGGPKMIERLDDWAVVVNPAGIALSLGARTYTKAGQSKVLAGDLIIAKPLNNVPAGYLVGEAYAVAAGTTGITVLNPVLLLNAAVVTITLAVFAWHL